ncbi:MAG: omptin family outer membrane protease [Treponema sp.]|nr:omptin family outer membrane protease [Treponema sp.]
MKKIWLVILFVIPSYFVFTLPAEAETTKSDVFYFPYTFSVSSSFGLLYGQGEEIVYKTPEADRYLSQLLWDMKSLFYVASSLDLSRIDPWEGIGFFTGLSVKFGISGKTGKMEDRDWLSPYEYLTHYSSHDNYSQGNLLLDFSLGLSLPINNRILFKFYGTLVYMSLSWAAQDGYYQYAKEQDDIYQPWDESIQKVDMFGSVINYSQEWLIIVSGLALQVSLSPCLGAEFSLQIGPPIHCYAQDEHIYTGTIYKDIISGGIYLEPRGRLFFSPHKKIELSLELSYRMLKGGQGVSYYRTDDTESFSKARSFDGAGAAYSVLDTGLSFKIRF